MFPSTFPAMASFLSDFLSDAPVLVEEFNRLLKQAVLLYCARKASYLPSDIWSEVVQETLLLLRSPDRAAFDLSRGSAESFLFSKVRSAVKNVRSAYGFHIYTATEDEESANPVEVSEPDTEVADPHYPEHRILLMVLTNEILDRAGEPMGKVLSRIYLEGQDQETVLMQSGMDRFSFRRRCRKIGREISTLGKCA